MSDDDAPNDSPLYGVSLRRYAALNAALGEGFPLERILTVERVAEHNFERADAKWKNRLAEASAAGPGGLAERYQTELAAAEDWLTRRVEPLDSDASAWVTFFEAYSSAPDPAGMLARVKLSANDISRLVRLWKRRAEQDPSILSQISVLPLSPDRKIIRTAPPVLRRSRRWDAVVAQSAPPPEARQEAVVPAAAHDDSEIEAFGLDRYASFNAELEVFPKEVARVRAKYGVASEADHSSLANRFRAFIAADIERDHDYRRYHNVALDRARKVAASTSVDERAAAVSGDEEGKAAVLSTFAAQLSATPKYMPFGNYDTPPVERAAPPVPEKPREGATQDVSALLAGSALPFVPEDPSTSSDEAAERAVALAEANEGPAPKKPQAGGTQDVSSLLTGVELPAGWQHESESAAAAPVAAAPAAVAPAVVAPAAVAPAAVAPAAVAPAPAAQANAPPPVRPAPPGPTSPYAKGAAIAMPVLPDLTVEQYGCLQAELALRPGSSRETLARYRVPPEAVAMLDAVWKQRIGSDPQTREAFSKANAAYKGWLAGQQRGNLVAPRLTLEQYASLLVDLSRDPARRAETLARYRIDEAERASIEAFYQHQFAADPRARAAFDQATQAYRVWLSGNRRG